MKAQFDFTVDDLIDASERTLARSRVAQGWRSRGVWAAALFGGLVGWAVRQDLLFAFFGAALCAVTQPFLAARARKARLLRYFRERLGGSGPFHCEVELTPEALVTTQAGVRTVREWPSVIAIVETGDAIEFHTRGAGSLVVRNRAFQSREQWKNFLDMARQYAKR